MSIRKFGGGKKSWIHVDHSMVNNIVSTGNINKSQFFYFSIDMRHESSCLPFHRLFVE